MQLNIRREPPEILANKVNRDGTIELICYPGDPDAFNTVFPNAGCAVALIDRLTHHADIVAIAGESRRDAQAHQKQQRPPV